MRTVYKVVRKDSKGRLVSAIVGNEWPHHRWEREWVRVYRDSDGTCPLVPDCFAFSSYEYARLFLRSVARLSESRSQIWKAEVRTARQCSTVAPLEKAAFERYHENSANWHPAPVGTMRCRDLQLVERVTPDA